jgi:hypothetical protein
VTSEMEAKIQDMWASVSFRDRRSPLSVVRSAVGASK